MRADVVIAILSMGVASYLCRVSGYLIMGYVAITRGVEAWLRAIPIAVIGAILGPVAARGGPPEWLGLAAAIGVMRATHSDFLSAVAAVAVVATTRALPM
jgi:branched chain amino acid efflux pump